MLSLDRTERKEAMMAWSALYASVAPDLEKQYIELCNIRRKEAEKLGFDSYIDMIYLVRHRFDYDAKDVENFRNAIAKYVVPVTAKLYDLQRKRLGLSIHYSIMMNRCVLLRVIPDHMVLHRKKWTVQENSTVSYLLKPKAVLRFHVRSRNVCYSL